MELFQPIINNSLSTLIISEPYSNFLCIWCQQKEFCPNSDIYNSLFIKSNLLNIYTFSDNYITLINEALNPISNNIKNIVYAIGEPNLVKYRKDLYKLSKHIFNSYKTTTQILFTNTTPYDLTQLKASFKYLTYIDLLMQNYKPKMSSNSEIRELSCLFNNATYISLIDLFTTNRIVYKNL